MHTIDDYVAPAAPPGRRIHRTPTPARQPVCFTSANPHAPLVSILIPAFNAEEWIADTLRSALAQTWHRKEIIVVDDGSSDRTAAIVKKFAPQGVRLDQGASAAQRRFLALSWRLHSVAPR